VAAANIGQSPSNVLLMIFEGGVARPVTAEDLAGSAVGAASPNKSEDTAHTTADVGTAVMAVQKAAPADLASEGDYAFPQAVAHVVTINGSPV
jgi:hypothetical protein